MDYSIFYKKELPLNEDWDYYCDIYISAYNKSDRCKFVNQKIKAGKKYSFVLPEYNFLDSEIPNNDNSLTYFYASQDSEMNMINKFYSNISPISCFEKICLDITGFMRPQFIYLIKFLNELGLKNIDVIYSEPSDYIEKENTKFSDGSLNNIRQINGFEGNHFVGNTNELLIIGSGYDHKLITGVCDYKKKAEVVQLYGFPSLKADMIQQNILRAHKAYYDIRNPKHEEEDSFWDRKNVFYAPANDPFITANTLKEIISSWDTIERLNIYLSPISSKPQALGFAIYYLWECKDKPISLLYPFSKRYNPSTTTGISKVWLYTLELE